VGVLTEPALTIDELARETGMTVRNIRTHQSRGLLPPPDVRSRTGYYGPDHVARIKLIQEMQADGFNLASIQRLLEGASGAVEEALGFKRAALAPFVEEEPEFATLEELDARFGGAVDQRSLRQAEKLGLIRDVGDGRYEIPSPTLLRAGEELIDLGVPLRHVLAVAERITKHSRAIAEAFVRVFVQDVAGPLDKRGSADPEDWERVREAVERLRPLATDALVAGFQQTMTRAVERSFSSAVRG
jgi:DNA-binding transcriptional MerR regulator